MVREQDVAVLTPGETSGAVGSRFIDCTTNTSWFNGSKLRSTVNCWNVLAALSVVPNPMEIVDDVSFNPLGMDKE